MAKKPQPLEMTSKSLFDSLAPEQPVVSASGESEIVVKRTSVWAILALFFGILSLLSLMITGFLFFSGLAIVWSLLAFWFILRSGGELTGKGFAGAGLALGLATLISGPTSSLVYEYQFGRQANEFAQMWFDAVRDGNPELAHNMLKPWWQRGEADTEQEKKSYWLNEMEGDEEPHQGVHQYLSNPTLLTISHFGDRASMSYYATEDNYLTPSQEITNRIYAITIAPETPNGEKLTFFINLKMERMHGKTEEGEQKVGWKLAMNDYSALPLDAQGRPYIKK